MRKGTDQKNTIAAIKSFFPTVSRVLFFFVAKFPKVTYDRRVSCIITLVGYTRGLGGGTDNKCSESSAHPVMPKPSKARRAALQREEIRRLERESSLVGTLPQPTERLGTEPETL